MSAVEITIPASTSNLGASFDTCGLALALYLKVRVEERAKGFEVITTGEGADRLPRDETNLIAHVARQVAEERGRNIGGARLLVDNQIPLSRGLGSSSAAIIAGISVYEALAEERLSEDEFFSHALHFESHGDNLAPSRLGGLVVTCLVEREGGRRSLVNVKREWPEEVKIILLIPDLELTTAAMRAVLPPSVPMSYVVFNLQRAALLQAALAEKRFDLLGEALRDRLHQPFRAPLAPGTSEVLQLNDAPLNGLLGIAISGAGSSLIAFATGNCGEIAAEMWARMKASGSRSRTLEIGVDNRGRVVSAISHQPSAVSLQADS
ncbi:MAG: homoserine kinase [Blastocatellia bacterium]|nr:homoserine kinase [Blastocatellia bacterium]